MLSFVLAGLITTLPIPMKKFSLALLTFALLSACGQRGASPETGDKPAAVAEEADAARRQSQADASFAAEEAKRTRDAATAAEAAAKRVATYKRELLPLITGNYPGECTAAKDGVKSRAAIAVAADGTVSAPGMKARDRSARTSRRRRVEGLARRRAGARTKERARATAVAVVSFTASATGKYAREPRPETFPKR